VVLDEDRAGSLADVGLRPDLTVPRLEDGSSPGTLVAAPLRMAPPTAAVLEVYGLEPGDWSHFELRLVQWCAVQCGRILTITRLREELGRLADGERAARAQVEWVSREKDEFVATLAHELRTPIGAILGWATLLRMAADRPDELEKALSVIERNARQQAQLISDLLDVNQAVGGKLRLDMRRFDPVTAIDAALDVARPAAEDKNIRLVRRVQSNGQRIMGDASRIEQVVWNLLTNALKFSEPGGEVAVDIAADERFVRITVTDEGQGIEPELIPHLFQRYRQGDSTPSRRHGGLGLGLAIVKHLVEIHRGTVHLHSDGPGRGARCTVTLPAAGVVEEAAGSCGESGAPDGVEQVTLAGISILLVDDDPDTLEFVARMLRQHGARVTPVGSAARALDSLQDRRPDLLISDIGMPGMDGYELLRRVKQLTAGNGPRLPAIAMTAFARSEDRTRALQAGFQLHLPKPVEAAELLAAVANLRGNLVPSGGDSLA
jgi:signal transduction histidine kinase/ActR/RegA family two-component response regulator